MPQSLDPTTTSDVLVIGSGLAGLWCALEASHFGTVTVVTKKERVESNTNYAQGGIAAVLDPEDSLDLHVRDTLRAGAGLCHPEAVRTVIGAGPPLVRRLLDMGVAFNRSKSDRLDLGREGGHSARRIVHAADRTGSAVEAAMLAAVASNPRIRVLDHYFGVDLILQSRLAGGTRANGEACWGAYVLTPEGAVVPFTARATVLASGGAGKVYLYTSNPPIATGDGVAMAFRAGAAVSDMEFVQFHPTCLFHPEARSFLITEALRGEGAILTTLDGERFMAKHDPRGELAPRDIVARAIDHETKMRGDDHVWLDARHLGEAFLNERFPQVTERCRSLGIDPVRDRIPVVPAAHYMCGGVRTGLSGESEIPRLYAIGEVAHTGLHGANRLASNSLLEALVLGDRAAAHLRRWLDEPDPPAPDPWESPTSGEPREDVVINHNWRAIRRLMWDYVGIERSDERLQTALPRLKLMREEVERFYRRFAVDADLIELRNLVLVAELVLLSALARKESRGLHFNRDYPEAEEGFRRDSLVRRGAGVTWGDLIDGPTGGESA